MALLSTKGVYGLAAILQIAKASEVAPISIKVIAQRTGISKNYLEQILNALRNERLVCSIKGKNGGYHLAKDASEITFGELFAALEKDLRITNLEIGDPNLRAFFGKFDEKLRALFDAPLSSYEEMMAQSAEYLNFSI